uniref:Uncharacterized protein n=1 Tax=Xenopus tropicalis TaxID=8364 RepID=A0A803J6Q1_XENTR
MHVSSSSVICCNFTTCGIDAKHTCMKAVYRCSAEGIGDLCICTFIHIRCINTKHCRVNWSIFTYTHFIHLLCKYSCASPYWGSPI